jgi:hypothetical protein
MYKKELRAGNPSYAKKKKKTKARDNEIVKMRHSLYQQTP